MDDREPVCLQSIGAKGIGLQVRFSWREDRHCHTISLLVGDREVPVFESIEGSSHDRWPPSPPLQQLSVEELRPKTNVALLVGMAGKSHWSISVEPASGRAAIAFDVACKSREEVEQLGTGYLVLPDGLSITGKHDASIEVEGQTLRLRGDSDVKTTAQLKQDSSGLRIEPTGQADRTSIRWRYVVELI